MNEEQQAELQKASEKLNTLAQEKGNELEKICNQTLVPLIHEVTKYEGRMTVNVEAHGKIRVRDNQLIPDISSVATLVFHEEMPDIEFDPMGYAEEYVQRLVAEQFFADAIESINN